jgi:hypothetical protein
MAGSPLDPERLAEIRSAIDAYNGERGGASRNSMLRLVSVFAPLLVIVVVAAWFLNGNAVPEEVWTSPLHVFLYVGAVVAGIAGYFWATTPQRQAAQPTTNRLLPTIFGAIDNFRHEKGEAPASFKRLPRELTGNFNRERFDDVVTGSYRGFDFELFEATFSEGDTPTFSGAGLAFEAERPFPGVLIAGLQTPKTKGFFGKLFGGRALEQVSSGVDELDQAYVFRSDNPDAARQLLTGSLASALRWLGEMWPDGRALVALKGSDAFVLLPSARNLFELPQGPQPIDFDKDVRPMVTDVFVMLETAALLRKLS